MFGKWLRAAFAALVLVAGGAQATPIEAYGRLPSLSDVILSPDGTQIAYVRTGETKRWIVVQKLGQPRPIATVDMGDAKFRYLRWADNSHIIFLVSSMSRLHGFAGLRQELGVPKVIDLRTGRQYDLFEQGMRPAPIRRC